MENFKEFQGRDLDECIKEACEYFNSPREKLEIELLQDAKSGIFGIVGARKAKIRARRASLQDAVQNILGEPQRKKKDTRPVSHSARKHEKYEPKFSKRTDQDDGKAPKMEHGTLKNGIEVPLGQSPQKNADSDIPKSAQPTIEEDIPQITGHEPAQSLQENPETPEMSGDSKIDEAETEGFRHVPLDSLDAGRLESLTKEIVAVLVKPVAGHDVPISVEIGNGRIRAKVDWHGDAGLLIGREGQTLAAMQYLASRMLSCGMNAAIRIQLDIGDYRRKQDDKLIDLAKALADKARKTGRAFSTRPLSSYHRRIIHLCLQDDPDVQTRSSGEGPLKRVLISPKKAQGKV